VLAPGAHKPMARVRRVTLFEREIRERLSHAALEILIERADVLSEGQREGGARFYGSTMITIDLSRHADLLREPCDAASARRVADLFRQDARACARVRRIAEREALRLAGGPLSHIAVELKLRWQGARVFVDADVEASIS